MCKCKSEYECLSISDYEVDFTVNHDATVSGCCGKHHHPSEDDNDLDDETTSSMELEELFS